MEKTELFVYGASGHGKVVADIAQLCGYRVVGYIDDHADDACSYEQFLADHPNAFVALGIGDNRSRSDVFQRLKARGTKIATLIHPVSVVASSARIGTGSVIMAGAVVNPDALIERGCIINSNAVIEHDNMIDQFSHVSPGVSLAGNVSVGAFSHIGIGTCAIQGVRIGSHTIIGAGSTIIRDIPDNVTALGTPAKVISNE
jgi:sugar O-acyltransferase (sialic acid O-acetyltransferase NeuD family)